MAVRGGAGGGAQFVSENPIGWPQGLRMGDGMSRIVARTAADGKVHFLALRYGHSMKTYLAICAPLNLRSRPNVWLLQWQQRSRQPSPFRTRVTCPLVIWRMSSFSNATATWKTGCCARKGRQPKRSGTEESGVQDDSARAGE